MIIAACLEFDAIPELPNIVLKMKIPKKIDLCPIVDGVVELRFKSTIFPNAVFGLIFNALQKDFPTVEKLPILQLPEQLRDLDPNFRFKAQYRITSKDGYSVHIGPDVLIIGASMPYKGWEEYFSRIELVIEQVFKTNVIEQILRLGVRFINFFDEDIFQKINLNISINDSTHQPSNTQLRTEIVREGFLNTLNLANNATQKLDQAKERSGSIIDIDTFRSYEDKDFYGKFKSEINKAHIVEKEIFFNLLKTEYLNSLNPQY